MPNVAFESNMQQSYRSRGSGQPQKLPLFQAALVCLQRAPTKGVRRQQKGKGKKRTKKNKKKVKERRLVRYRAERARAKGKGEGCHSHAPTLNEHSPSAFPLQAGGSADFPYQGPSSKTWRFEPLDGRTTHEAMTNDKL